MILYFKKYQGAGNDFILIDTRQTNPDLTAEMIRSLCDRRFGIGADGLITIGKDPVYPFLMRYYNSDGKESTMCGNGGRCVAWYAMQHNIGDAVIEFNAIDGIHFAKIIQYVEHNALVKLKMQDVNQIREEDNFTLLNTGSPHYVTFCDDVKSIDIRLKGREIRNSHPFRDEGINVNFVEWQETGLFVRTYERGVEDETLSCGTGVTASALVAAWKNPDYTSPVKVSTLGGTLYVSFLKKGNGYTDIWLEGQATKVFSGTIEI